MYVRELFRIQCPNIGDWSLSFLGPDSHDGGWLFIILRGPNLFVALKLNLLPLNVAASLPPVVAVNDSAQSASIILDFIVNANKICQSTKYWLN